MGAAVPTWESELGSWQAWLRVSGKPETTLGVRRVQLHRLALDFAHREPWDLTLDDLVVWLMRPGWKPETMRSYRAALRSFWAWGVMTGRTAHNPAAMLPTIKAPQGVPRPAPDTVIAAARVAAPERTALMIRLAAECGLRCCEVAGIHSRDIVADLFGWSLIVTGKGGRERSIPLAPRMALALRSLPAGWAFPNGKGRHLSPHYVSKLLSKALGAGWTAHQLRHRFASTAYAAERDLRAVQELLGHSKPETTARYTAIPEGAKRVAVLAAAS